jgi:Zn-finger nucleic acid-binding protein
MLPILRKTPTGMIAEQVYVLEAMEFSFEQRSLPTTLSIWKKCMTCSGVWFDQGELKTLIESNLVHYLAEFWTAPWQRKQRLAHSRKSFLQLNEELLGTEVYQLTINLADKIKDHPEKDRVFDLLRHELFG